MDISNTSGSSCRNRIPSYSAESSNSATSSISSEHSSNLMMAMVVNKQFTSSNCNSTSSDEQNLHNVLVVYPNGYNTIKKIDSKKPIYDLLIELSAEARLIPTNYTLNLYHHVENSVDENYEKKLEYTPNQTIGQLNPNKIEILPKTTTLKHQQQLQILSPTLDNQSNSSNSKRRRFFKSSDYSNNINKNYSINLNKSSSDKNKSNTINLSSTSQSYQNYLNTNNNISNYVTPFELTIRVEVNLPFNQKTTVRVRPDIELNDLFEVICREGSLQKDKYVLTLPNYELDEIDMNNPLSFYDTKEVNLMFSKHQMNNNTNNHLYVQKTLLKNKKCNNSILNHLYRKNQQNENNSLNKKSKSEIDLSSDSNNNYDQIKKKNSIWKKSNANLENLNNNTDQLKATSRYSMFNFFTSTNKKNLNHSATMMINKTNSSDINYENRILNDRMKYMTANLDSKNMTNLNKTKTFTYGKKRHAPPPPPTQTPPLSTLPSTTVQQSRPEHKEIELDLDSIRKLINLTKKKKKAPAPPPPVHSNQPKKVENAIKQEVVAAKYSITKTNEHKKTIRKLLYRKSNSLTNLDYKTSNNEINTMNKHASNDNLKVINRLKTKLSLDSNWKAMKKSLDESFTKKSSLLNKQKIITSSSISNSPNFKESININLSISTIGDASNSYNMAEEKILTITEKIIPLSFDNENITIKEKNNKNEPGSKSPSIKSDSSIRSLSIDFQNHPAFNRPVYESTIDDNFFFGLNRNHNNKPGGLQFENKIYDLNNTINRTKWRKLEKRNFTVEVRPRLETIVNYQKYDDQSNILDLNNKFMRNNEIYEMGLSEPATLTIRTELDHNHHYLDSITSPRIQNDTSHLKSIFCAPTSPPPQFPAIAESEINEIHGNYTVVRSGAIIEKNGTYYSNDGTIRGYSGTVKKMANSKTLNEIFSNRSSELNKQNNKIVKNEIVNNNNNNDDSKSSSSTSRTCNLTKPCPLSPVTEAISPVSNQELNTSTKKESKLSSRTLSSNANIFKKAPFSSNFTKELAHTVELQKSNVSKTLPYNKDQSVERPKSAILNNKTTDEIKPSRSSAIIYNNNNNNNYNNFSNRQCDFNGNIALINQEILSTFKPALPPRKDYPISSPSPPPPPPPLPPPPPPQFAGTEFHGFDQMNLDNALINDYVKKNLQLNNDPIILEVTNDDFIENSFIKNDKTRKESNIEMNNKKVGANITIVSTHTNSKPQPPKVAPKNFSHDAIESINKKNNVLSIRENLMESIKNFNIANLRSSSINT